MVKPAFRRWDSLSTFRLSAATALLLLGTISSGGCTSLGSPASDPDQIVDAAQADSEFDKPDHEAVSDEHADSDENADQGDESSFGLERTRGEGTGLSDQARDIERSLGYK